MTPEQLAALQASATRPRRTVPVVLDGEIRSAVEELLLLLEKTPKEDPDRRLGSGPSAYVQLVAEIDALTEQAADKTLQVVIEGLPGTEFAAFKAQHPKRDGNRADGLWHHNTEAGRAPLIQLTAIGYRDTLDQVHSWAPGQLDWLIGWATESQLDSLYLAALACCAGDDAVPLRPQPSTTQTSAAE